MLKGKRNLTIACMARLDRLSTYHDRMIFTIAYGIDMHISACSSPSSGTDSTACPSPSSGTDMLLPHAPLPPVEYKKDMPENDPKALFQQQVPKSFLDLQDRIREEVADRAGTGDSPPIMDAEQFQ